MRYARVLSTGRYVPEKVLTNADVEALLGEPVGFCKVSEWGDDLVRAKMGFPVLPEHALRPSGQVGTHLLDAALSESSAEASTYVFLDDMSIESFPT